jgi:hypothetical protein
MAFRAVERGKQNSSVHELNLQQIFGPISAMPGAHGRVS